MRETYGHRGYESSPEMAGTTGPSVGGGLAEAARIGVAGRNRTEEAGPGSPVAASSRPPPTRLRGGGDAERGETLNAEFLMLTCYGVCRRQIAAKAAATLNFALHSLPFSLHRARGAGVAARASPTMGGGRDMSFHSSLFALRTSHFTAYAVPAGPGWLRGRGSACMRACPLPRIDGRFAEQRRRRWGWLHFLVA